MQRCREQSHRAPHNHRMQHQILSWKECNSTSRAFGSLRSPHHKGVEIGKRADLPPNKTCLFARRVYHSQVASQDLTTPQSYQAAITFGGVDKSGSATCLTPEASAKAVENLSSISIRAVYSCAAVLERGEGKICARDLRQGSAPGIDARKRRQEATPGITSTKP